MTVKVALIEVVKHNSNTYLNTPKTVGAVQPVEAVERVELIKVVKHNSSTFLNTPKTQTVQLNSYCHAVLLLLLPLLLSRSTLIIIATLTIMLSLIHI